MQGVTYCASRWEKAQKINPDVCKIANTAELPASRKMRFHWRQVFVSLRLIIFVKRKEDVV